MDAFQIERMHFRRANLYWNNSLFSWKEGYVLWISYLAISVQKFYKTFKFLALKKFQKPKPDQTFPETLSASLDIYRPDSFIWIAFWDLGDLILLMKRMVVHVIITNFASICGFWLVTWLPQSNDKNLVRNQGRTDSYRPYLNWKTSFARPQGHMKRNVICPRCLLPLNFSSFWEAFDVHNFEIKTTFSKMTF